MLVIFDLDGTLLNTITDLGLACNHALRACGYSEHDIDEYPHLVGNGVNRLIMRALPVQAHTDEAVQRVREAFIPYYDVHNCDNTQPYAGIQELLAHLRERGCRLAVASNKYHTATLRIVEHFFPGMFDVVLGEREDKPRKPDPQIVSDILAQAHVSAGESVFYAGDSLVDADTARAAGLPFLACAWGFCSLTELQSAEPTLLAQTPTDILAHLFPMTEKVAVISNPTSGKRAFRAQKKWLLRQLSERHIACRYMETRYAGHASELARSLVEQGCTQLLAVGGDGTFSEMVHGIMSARVSAEWRSRIVVGLMPRGTGNDWGRFWHLTRQYRTALQRFLDGEDHPIDVGCLLFERNGEEQRRYFINSVGFGVDSMCCARAEQLKYYLGSHAFNYFIALLLSLRHQKPLSVTLLANGKQVFAGGMFTMNVGNGPFSGGGIRQNPDADPQDGLFHSMCAERPTFRQVMRTLPHLFDGRLLEMEFIHTFTGSNVEVLAAQEQHFCIESDGIVTHFTGPCRLICLHHAFRFRA